MSFLDDLPRPFFVLAPMDDVTDTVFRQIVADCATPDLYFTEFVNVDGLQSPGRPNLLRKLQFTDKEQPLIAQIWGKIPENFYKTAQELMGMGFAGIDLNMGCPQKTEVKNGACAALINNKELASEIINATIKGAGGKVPVSVKTRIGFNDVDLSWPEFLLSKKLNMLTIHGRTAAQMSKVPADWDMIGRVRQMRDELSPSTLIVGNGDVQSREQGEKLAKKYNLDGIMIGRGIFNDPFAFMAQSPWQNYTPHQKIALYKKHVQLFIDTWGRGEQHIAPLNKFCKVYVNGFDGAKDLRDKLMHAKDSADLLHLLESEL